MSTDTVQSCTESGGTLNHYRAGSDVMIDNRTYVETAFLNPDGT